MEGKKGDGFTLNLIIINISYIKHLTVQLKILNDFFLQLRWGGGDWLTPPSSTGIGLIEKLLLDLNWKDHLIKHFWVLFYCRFRKNFVFYLDVRKTYELYWLICEFAVADLLEFKKILILFLKKPWWKWEEKLAIIQEVQ